MIRIGYACINTELAEENITVNRTARLNTIEQKGAEFIKSLVLQNLEDLAKVLEWNEKHGLRFYRLSSDMISHLYNEKLSKEIIEAYTLDFARDKLADIGKYARNNAHRLTFHPGQYTLLSSGDPKVIKNAIRDIEIHADILAAMGLTPEMGSVIILHGGGTYGDKPAAIDRIRKNLALISPEVRKYISFENDERGYSPSDLLPICEEFNIPFTLDVFHYKCMVAGESSLLPTYSQMLTDYKLWDRIARTWRNRNIKQKIHISSQRPDSRLGSHSDFINAEEINLRQVLCNCKKYMSDIMVEAKAKEKAALAIYNEYFDRVENARTEWYLKNIC